MRCLQLFRDERLEIFFVVMCLNLAPVVLWQSLTIIPPTERNTVQWTIVILFRLGMRHQMHLALWLAARLQQVCRSWTEVRLCADRIIMLDAALLFQIGIGPCRWIRKHWGAPSIECWLMWLVLRGLSLERVIKYLVLESFVHHAHVEVVLNGWLGFPIPGCYCQVKNIRLCLLACVGLYCIELLISDFTEIFTTLLVVRRTDATERGLFPVSMVFIRRTSLRPVVGLALRLLRKT